MMANQHRQHLLHREDLMRELPVYYLHSQGVLIPLVSLAFTLNPDQNGQQPLRLGSFTIELPVYYSHFSELFFTVVSLEFTLKPDRARQHRSHLES